MYKLFLDHSMMYSCAIHHPGQGLYDVSVVRPVQCVCVCVCVRPEPCTGRRQSTRDLWDLQGMGLGRPA